jgi:hypothetical protein
VGHGRRPEQARARARRAWAHAGAGVAATTERRRWRPSGRGHGRRGRAGAEVGDAAGAAREATAERRRWRRGAATAAEKFGSLPASLELLACGDLVDLAMRGRRHAVIKERALAPVGGFNRC